VGLGSTGVIRSNADKRGTGDVEKDGDAWGEGVERGDRIAGLAGHGCVVPAALTVDAAVQLGYVRGREARALVKPVHVLGDHVRHCSCGVEGGEVRGPGLG